MRSVWIGRGMKNCQTRPPRKQAEATCKSTTTESTATARPQPRAARLSGLISRASKRSDVASHTGSSKIIVPTAIDPSRAAWRTPTNPSRNRPLRRPGR